MHSLLARIGLWLFIGFVVLVPSTTRATSVIELTFNDLVSQADVIAVGTVTDIREQYDEAKKAPLTLVTVSNLTTLKGSPGSSFTLEFLGGKLPNGLVMTIPGVPQFKVGEKIVVFCAGNRRDFCPLVGIWQGVMRVMTDPQRGIETVSDNFRVPIITIHDGALIKRSAETGAQEPLPLTTFMQIVKQTLQTVSK
jgi:hypothetical protein